MKFKSTFEYLAALMVFVGCGSSAHERADAGMETPNEDAGLRRDMDITAPPADAGGTPAGDHCDDAPTLPTTAVGVAGTTAGTHADHSFGSGCVNASGPEVSYRVVVPANRRLTVTVDPATGFDVVVDIARACSAAVTCVASTDSPTPTDATETLSYTNASNESETLYVFVRSYSNSQDDFRISASLAEPLGGETCGNATDITAGTLAGQTTLGFAHDFASSEGFCPSFANGPDRVYRISVPAGQELRATVSPDTVGDYDPSLALALDGANACDPDARCVAGSDSGTTDAVESATFFNASAEARSVLVVVGGGLSSVGDFLLETSFMTPAPGERCGTATPLPLGTLTAQTTAGFADDYGSDFSAGCRGASGPDRVYAIDVPSTKTLTITATPEGFDIAVSLFASLDTCDGADFRCAASIDSAFGGVAETVTYRNTGAMTRTIYVAIDGDRAGDFMLETSIE